MKDNWQVAWPCVIGANLIVPLMWALPITSPGGRLGMAFGIALVWLLGHLAFARFTQLRHTILIGGGLVGLTQLLPFLHLFAGGLAFVFLQGFGLLEDPFEDRLTALGGLVATLLMASQLFLLSALLGLGARVLAGEH